MSYECPLCATSFEHANCRSSCPIARGCSMVRCPRCGYEFVESGRIADLLRRWIRRAPKTTPVRDDGAVCLADLRAGESGEVVFISRQSPSRNARLAAYGIVEGTRLTLVARRPTVVLECGATTLAVEPEIGRAIFVSRDAHSAHASP
jgi:Fe2+ transport system protein FeoA